MIPLIRYPGSKAKLAKQIWATFPPNMLHQLWMYSTPTEYREPFFGAGAVGFHLLDLLPPTAPVWINDIDYGMYSLWQTVWNDPDSLIRRCNKFTPSAKYFYDFKAADGDDTIPVEQTAFRKLALHRMSFSGLGAKAGGPIGGKNQATAAYCVGCRWNPEHIKRNVVKANKLFRRFLNLRITRLDFQHLIDDAPAECFIYLDPPYYLKGPALYAHAMSEADHQRLADALKACLASWVLSYDDHPEVRRLYDGHEVRDLHVTYSMAVNKEERPKNREVLIFPEQTPALGLPDRPVLA